MRRKWLTVACAVSLTVALSAAEPVTAAPKVDDGRASLRVFVGDLTPEQVETLRGTGVDDIAASAGAGGRVNVEVILSARQAERLRDHGVTLTEKRVGGQTAADALRAQAAAGQTVYRSYSEPGGIRDELVSAAAAHPGIAKLVTVGRSLSGQQILAVKVTKNARFTKDGSRPSVMYLGAQHAREWITPEMVRRLMHEVLAGYGTDPTWTSLVNTRELWFLPVANPDGYDFTFTEGNRLWRKNLRDIDGNGEITVVDGVDLNRNYPTRWGMDNEGSSPDPSSETYRGAGPASEPETRALDALFRRVGFTFFINYHSAAQLLLYGVGWQVSTPTPDDEIYKALAGDDANSAIPGYDPDISAELYTVNGDTDTHMTARYHTLGFTPEMTTCQTVSNSDPNDEWVAADCASGFNFPDDEELIQAEFAKNIPFARSVAQSAANPSEPVSSVGLTAPDLVPDAFDVSYGRDQAVAVTAKRSLKNLKVRYSVNGGPTKSVGTKEWRGGERYGDTDDHYYGEFRGTVRNTRPGDSVEVWFTATKPGTGAVSSAHFTYTVHTDIGAKVLILAVEDVTGASFQVPTTATSSEFADEYAASLAAAGYSTDVYDFDAQGRKAPHPLGVLSHYKAVVWETGNDRFLRAVGQPAGTVAKVTLDIELAVRDYLNEGGKLLVSGQSALLGQAFNGSLHYNPFAPPECTTPNVYPCLPILNDFQQYYLGAYVYVDNSGFDDGGNPFPLSGTAGRFAGFAGALNAAGSAGNQAHNAGFLATSSLLPPAQFPTFNPSSTPVDWVRPVAGPFNPHTGTWHVFSGQAELSYKRLTRTIDLGSATTASLEFFTSFDTEPSWDFLFVEAHTVGEDNWTTLADTNGNTSTDTGDSCPSGWHDIHPFLAHYQTFDPAAETCTSTGTSGAWNAASGNSGGWQDWSLDLSAFAGDQVEVSISYVSDWFFQGLGVFVDDTTVTVDGATVATTSFEAGLDGWTVAGPAPGSAPGATDWERTQRVIDEGAVAVTKDTVYTGFGLEGLAPATRDDFVRRSMKHLLG